MGLDKDERENFMKEIGLNRTGLNKLIREGYDLLNLDTYFTSGPEESSEVSGMIARSQPAIKRPGVRATAIKPVDCKIAKPIVK